MTGVDANTRLEAAFMELIQEKPFSKITVNEIVERAGVHRNTFYYHYQSIPVMVGEICRKYTDKVYENCKDLSSPADCILPFVRDTMKVRQAILNLYFSEVRNILMDYVRQIGRISIEHYIDNVTKGKGFDKHDRELLTRFYASGLIGAWYDWVEDGMETDPSEDFIRLGEILKKTALDTFPTRS